MKNQVLSIEQMRKLKELGVDTGNPSCYEWFGYDFLNRKVKIIESSDDCHDPNIIKECGVFTLQDIIEMLPKMIYTQHIYEPVLAFISAESTVAYFDHTEGEVLHSCKHINTLQAAYDMLVWCAENGYLKGGSNA